MHFSTFIVKPPRPCVKSRVLSGSVLGIGVKRCRVILTARGHPRSPIHTHTITQTCTHTYAQAFSHTLYMLEKNILTFALKKQYKGLSVIKYLWC